MHARNARMKLIRRDILLNTNIKNHKFDFEMKIQNPKMFMLKPKYIRAH